MSFHGWESRCYEVVGMSGDFCQPASYQSSHNHNFGPHAADVEWLFSNLTGFQGVKWCNLTVNTFETMRKLQANYNYHLHQQAQASWKPICHQHGHMHTHNEPGLNVYLSADLKTNFTWTPPLAAQK